jgi:acetate kinase
VTERTAILTLNVGSSSVKFALFERDGLGEIVHGSIDGIGSRPHVAARGRGIEAVDLDLGDGPADQAAAVKLILGLVTTRLPDVAVAAVGHRIVHGGAAFAAPVRLDDAVLARLDALVPLAPLHQPHNLAGVRAAIATFPAAPQIGCFDTAFHRGHPWVSDTFALPRGLYDEGVRRYGFHGLSYESILRRLREIAPELADKRLAVAHLGAGASMCAIEDGVSVGSTMGFSALDGLPMGTRCGQLDPGVLLWLMAEKRMGERDISELLYKDSGLKGLSGLSGDVRILEASDRPEAAEALDYFVFRTRREFGAMAAILGGLDAIVLTGGIGEHAATIRKRLLEGFAWLGLELDLEANAAGRTRISTPESAVTALVVPTAEEETIALHVRELLDDGGALG